MSRPAASDENSSFNQAGQPRPPPVITRRVKPQTTCSENESKSPVRERDIVSGCDVTEICFFDVETSFDENQIMEFACINVCRLGLYKLSEYSTLIKPSKGAVSKRDKEHYGITDNMTSNAPSFADVADQIYKHMNNKIWAGHNIIEHDIRCINLAFELLNKSPPQHAGVIDTLPLVQEVFLNRAGSNSLESLCKHFGLGLQRHRALADCHQNLEAIKSVACLLLFENKFPGLYPKQCLVSQDTVAVSRHTAVQSKMAVPFFRTSEELLNMLPHDFISKTRITSDTSQSSHTSTMRYITTRSGINVTFRDSASSFPDHQKHLISLIDAKVKTVSFYYDTGEEHTVLDPQWVKREIYLFKGMLHRGKELQYRIDRVRQIYT